MSNVKHVHEVLFLFQEFKTFADETQMLSVIKSRLGDDVQFISCSQTPFPLEDVLHFLLERDKIIRHDDGSLSLHPSMTMCDGEHDHEH